MLRKVMKPTLCLPLLLTINSPNLLSSENKNNIENIIRENFDLRPKGIIKMLDLKKPIYQDTAAYGHFGRDDKTFSWELIDKAKNLIA